MKKVFSAKERKRIQNHFWTEEEQHPLLDLCFNVPNVRFAMLQKVQAEAEDVFYYVAKLMDYFYGITKMNPTGIWQDEVEDEWATLLRDVRDWQKATPYDCQLMADTIFRIVCRFFCLYAAQWRKDAPESKETERWSKLYKYIERTLDNYSKTVDQSDILNFENRLLNYFLNDGDILMDWMLNEYDGHLSAKIEKYITEESSQQNLNNGAVIQKSIQPQKRKRATFPVRESFQLSHCYKYKSHTIATVYKEMCDSHLIDNVTTNIDSFQNVFTGGIPDNKIVWNGTDKELRYFIFEGLKEKLFTCKTQKWRTVAACFKPANPKQSREFYSPIDFSKTSDPKGVKSLDKVNQALDIFRTARRGSSDE